MLADPVIGQNAVARARQSKYDIYRFVGDRWCWREMIVEYRVAEDQPLTKWSSWEDPKQGKYSAEYFVPSCARDIIVRFKVVGGPDVRSCERKHPGQPWLRGREEFHFAAPAYRDITFVLEGTSLLSFVAAVWDTNRNSPWTQREQLEHWSPSVHGPLPLPMSLPPYDVFLRTVADINLATRETLLNGLIAAGEAHAAALHRYKTDLLRIDKKYSVRWAIVNSVKTASAGLAVAAPCTLAVPPVSLVLGLCGAATGIGAFVGDAVTGAIFKSEFRDAVAIEHRSLIGLLRAFDEVLERHPNLTEEELHRHGGRMDLERAQQYHRQQRHEVGHVAAEAGHGAIHVAEMIVEIIHAVGEAEEAAGPLLRSALQGATQAARGAQAGRAAQGAAQVVLRVQLVLGIVGAVVAVGDCAYSWTHRDSFQKLIRKELIAVRRLLQLPENPDNEEELPLVERQ